MNQGARSNLIARHSRQLIYSLALAGACFGGSLSLAQSSVSSSAELETALANGGDYLVQPGRYVIENPAVIGNDLRLVGASPNDVLIEVLGAPEGIQITNGATVYLEGLRIPYAGQLGSDLIVVDGANLDLVRVDLGFSRLDTSATPPTGRLTSTGTGIVVGPGARVRGFELRMTRNEAAAIEVQDGGYLELVQSSIIENIRGIVGRGVFRVVLEGTALADQYAWAILLTGTGEGATLEMKGSHVANSGGVYVDSKNVFPALQLNGTIEATVEGGSFQNNAGGAGVLLGNSRMAINDGLVTGNGTFSTELDGSWAAFQLEGASMLVADNTLFVDNPNTVFDIIGTAGLGLTASVVEGSTGRVHTVIAEDGRAVFRATMFRSNVGRLFVTDNARVTITDSEVRGSTQDGIVFAGKSAGQITGSVVSDHGEVGIWIAESAHADVTRTTVANNNLGIWTTDEATSIVESSSITGNNQVGVGARGAGRTVVTSSQILNNATSGFAAIEQARALLEDSELRGNGRHGALFSGSGESFMNRNTIADSPIGVRIEGQANLSGTENVFENLGVEVEDVTTAP